MARSRTPHRSRTPGRSRDFRRAARPVALVGLVTASLLFAACSGGDGELTLSDARSRMSPMLTGVGAVFLDIENGTDEDDRLLGASVDAAVAGHVELHETIDTSAEDGATSDGAMQDEADDADGAMADDAEGMGAPVAPTSEGFAMMGMREIEALDIPAGETVSLAPGGYHLMLLDLAADLEPGQEFDLTLEFERAGERTVTVTVREQV